MDLMPALHMLLGLLALASAPQARAATEQNQSSSAILMQGFHWNSCRISNTSWYDILGNRSVDMKDLGITHVWFPPPSSSAACEGYLPKQLDVLDSFYGSEEQLRVAIAKFADQGISAVADLVLNHRVGMHNWADFIQPTWDCKAVVSNDEWPGRCGNLDSGAGVPYARDIDHNYPLVQADLKNYTSSRLKGVGFNGMRLDFVKGYSPSFAKIYHDAMNPNFCVAEYWSDLNYDKVNDHRQLLVNYVDGTAGQCGVFDFTTKGLLNRVLGGGEYWRLRDVSGKPQGGIGWWAQKMVTFVDNHDTGPSENAQAGQNHWPIQPNKVMEAYAYVLTHPGIPSVYYPHVYDWRMRDQIKALITARKIAGITSTSSVVIAAAEFGLYAARINGTNGTVAMRMGSNTAWSPGAWTLAARGDTYAVWTCVNAAQITFRVTCASVTGNQSVRVVGNVGGLGSWNGARGFVLTKETATTALWSGTLTLALPCGTALQYKYVKWDGSTSMWESNQATASGNREFTAPTNGVPVSRDDVFLEPLPSKVKTNPSAMVSMAADPLHRCRMMLLLAGLTMLARVNA